MSSPYEITPSDSPYARLSDLCCVRNSPDGTRLTISDEQFEEISELLHEIGKLEWAKRPRIYAVLRMMELQKEIDAFITLGHNDNSLPFRNKRSLPPELQPYDRSSTFLDLQKYVLNAACDLEKGDQGKHISVEDGERLFRRHKLLGTGGVGYVKTHSAINCITC